MEKQEARLISSDKGIKSLVNAASEAFNRPLPVSFLGQNTQTGRVEEEIIDDFGKPRSSKDMLVKTLVDLVDTGGMIFDAAHPYLDRAYSIINAFR